MLPDLPLGLPPPEVALPEVLHVRRMYRPVVSLPVRAPPRLYETIVQGQIVPDRVPPPRPSRPEVGVVVQDVLVDVGQDEFTLDNEEP